MAVNPDRIWSLVSAYDAWVKEQGVPIHKGYYIPDLRTVELGWWKKRECNAAFLLLAGQEGISEARVSEIPPGKTLPPIKFGFDEIVYVADGRGLTTVWHENNGGKKSFEWQSHSMFVIPRHHTHQLSNMQGDKPVRLLHYNYFPVTLSSIPDPEFFINNPSGKNDLSEGEEVFSEAKTVNLIPEGGLTAPRARSRNFWYGNFFPNMSQWDKFQTQMDRGAGASVVHLRFPNSGMCGHMSLFPSQRYKKAHRHGPGVIIVIPSGQGYSIMWPEGKEKVIIPWQESSVFVPPNRWFHQHFNTGREPARYLAFHAPRSLVGYGERVEDLARDQIEYVSEEPWIREKFEAELAKIGQKSLMPEEAYKDKNFQWAYSK